jgi:bifunctional non-homologous end joining protein LigD
MRPLPEPMLSRLSHELPSGDYAYELKWDGFRAVVSTTGGLRVRSRRGWNMTELVPELADLPPGLVLDGELIAFGEDGLPSFPLLCERMLHRRPGIPIAYMVFDLLEETSRSTMHWPLWQRRRRLDKLDLRGSHWQTSETFHDGEALLESVKLACLEGIVAKKLSQRYRPGERLWIKVKSRDDWRFPLERDAAIRGSTQRR